MHHMPSVHRVVKRKLKFLQDYERVFDHFVDSRRCKFNTSMTKVTII